MSRIDNKSGFTVVELLIVIIVIGILAGLVLTAFNSVQLTARDSERKTDINALHSQLEAYKAKIGFYPSTVNISDVVWVSLNFEGFETAALDDPKSGSYPYSAIPSGCDNSSSLCLSYTLSADLETDGHGANDSDSNTADYIKNSLE